MRVAIKHNVDTAGAAEAIAPAEINSSRRRGPSDVRARRYMAPRYYIVLLAAKA